MHTDWHRKIVFFRQGKVIWIMRWRTFHDCCTKAHINIIIRHDWQSFAICRVDGMQPNDVFITLIIRMNKDSLIGKHRFRTGCRND